MPGKPIILLPPSEGKEIGGTKSDVPGIFDSSLATQRRHLRSALRAELGALTTARAQSLFNARGKLLDRAIGSAKTYVSKSPSLLPAWQRYSGVVWTHLEPESLSAPTRRRVLVPSGLYGVTGATDLIADYRLTMNVSLSEIGGVAAFWRDVITKAVGDHVSGGVLIDLLPKEHRASLNRHELSQLCQLITVDFVQHDGKRAAGHGAKAAKGLLARAVLIEGIDSVRSFEWQGWKASRAGDVVIVRAPKPDR